MKLLHSLLIAAVYAETASTIKATSSTQAPITTSTKASTTTTDVYYDAYADNDPTVYLDELEQGCINVISQIPYAFGKNGKDNTSTPLELKEKFVQRWTKKCKYQRRKLESAFNRPYNGPNEGDCGGVPGGYQVNLTKDPANDPCAAIIELSEEFIRFTRAFLNGYYCPDKGISKANERMLRWKIALELKHSLDCRGYPDGDKPDLVVKADKSVGGTAQCRENVDLFVGRYRRVGYIPDTDLDGNIHRRMVYAKLGNTEENHWYFTEVKINDNYQWEFTSNDLVIYGDYWITGPPFETPYPGTPNESLTPAWRCVTSIEAAYRRDDDFPEDTNEDTNDTADTE